MSIADRLKRLPLFRDAERGGSAERPSQAHAASCLAVSADRVLFAYDADRSKLYCVDLTADECVEREIVIVNESAAARGAVRAIVLNRDASALAVVTTHTCRVLDLDQRFYRVLSSEPSGTLACRSFVAGHFFHRTHPTIEVRSVQWHPHSSDHIGVLTSDSTVRIYRRSAEALAAATGGGSFASSDDSAAEAVFRVLSLLPQPNVSPSASSTRCVAFTFGGDTHTSAQQDAWQVGWNAFAIYFVLSNGELYALCPYVPRGALLPQHLLGTMRSAAVAKLAALRVDKNGTPNGSAAAADDGRNGRLSESIYEEESEEEDEEDDDDDDDDESQSMDSDDGGAFVTPIGIRRGGVQRRRDRRARRARRRLRWQLQYLDGLRSTGMAAVQQSMAGLSLSGGGGAVAPWVRVAARDGSLAAAHHRVVLQGPLSTAIVPNERRSNTACGLRCLSVAAPAVFAVLQCNGTLDLLLSIDLLEPQWSGGGRQRGAQQRFVTFERVSLRSPAVKGRSKRQALTEAGFELVAPPAHGLLHDHVLVSHGAGVSCVAVRWLRPWRRELADLAHGRAHASAAGIAENDWPPSLVYALVATMSSMSPELAPPRGAVVLDGDASSGAALLAWLDDRELAHAPRVACRETDAGLGVGDDGLDGGIRGGGTGDGGRTPRDASAAAAGGGGLPSFSDTLTSLTRPSAPRAVYQTGANKKQSEALCDYTDPSTLEYLTEQCAQLMQYGVYIETVNAELGARVRALGVLEQQQRDELSAIAEAHELSAERTTRIEEHLQALEDNQSNLGERIDTIMGLVNDAQAELSDAERAWHAELRGMQQRVRYFQERMQHANFIVQHAEERKRVEQAHERERNGAAGASLSDRQLQLLLPVIEEQGKNIELASATLLRLGQKFVDANEL